MQVYNIQDWVACEWIKIQTHFVKFSLPEYNRITILPSSINITSEKTYARGGKVGHTFPEVSIEEAVLVLLPGGTGQPGHVKVSQPFHQEDRYIVTNFIKAGKLR